MSYSNTSCHIVTPSRRRDGRGIPNLGEQTPECNFVVYVNGQNVTDLFPSSHLRCHCIVWTPSLYNICSNTDSNETEMAPIFSVGLEGDEVQGSTQYCSSPISCNHKKIQLMLHIK